MTGRRFSLPLALTAIFCIAAGPAIAGPLPDCGERIAALSPAPNTSSHRGFTPHPPEAATTPGTCLSSPTAFPLLPDNNASVYAVHLEDVTLVVGGTWGLTLFDVTVPDQPRLASALRSPDPIVDLAPAGAGRVIVADDRGGVSLVDIMNPDRPQIQASINLRVDTFSVAATDTIALVSHIGGVEVLDLSQTGSIAIIARIRDVYPGRVTLQGDLAVIPDLSLDWFTLIDLSEPTEPKQLGIVGTGEHAHSAAIVGDTLLLSHGVDGVVVLDISDPTSPAQVAVLPGTLSAYSFTVRGFIVYIAAYDQGMMAFDLTDAAHPVDLGSFDTEHFTHKVSVWNGLAALADRDSVVLAWLGHDPLATEAARLRANGDANAVVPVGELLAVANGPEGLAVVDPRNGPLESLVARLDLSGNTHFIAPWADGVVAVTQGRGSSWRETSISLIRSIEEQTPRVESELRLEGNAWPPALSGHLLLVPSGPQVVLIDLAAPGGPRELSRFEPTGAPVRGIWAGGNHAIVATELGSAVVEISDPYAPVVRRLRDPEAVSKAAIDGQWGAYFDPYYARLYFVDFSDPEDPLRSTGAVELGFSVYQLALDRTTVYAAGTSQLLVGDFTDPEDFVVLGKRAFEPSFFPGRILLSDGRLILPTPKQLLVFPIACPPVTESPSRPLRPTGRLGALR